jgi:hypothetical protein
MSLTADFVRLANPVDVVEDFASAQHWAFDRSTDDEITINVSGGWTDYRVSITWMDELEALHIACAFDMKVPEPRAQETRRLLNLINGQIWVGHFDLWSEEGLVMFRHALLLSGGVEPSGRQCEALLTSAIAACERYFQAFQFVVWAGRGAQEAFDAASFETAGQA